MLHEMLYLSAQVSEFDHIADANTHRLYILNILQISLILTI